MRRIEQTTIFRRDFKREKKGQHGAKLDALLRSVLVLLVEDRPLPQANHDHALGGDRKGLRDCHLRPDLVLIYRKPDADTLQLVRLGSHSELFR
jgi:mRNA interferase YafQ